MAATELLRLKSEVAALQVSLEKVFCSSLLEFIIVRAVGRPNTDRPMATVKVKRVAPPNPALTNSRFAFYWQHCPILNSLLHGAFGCLIGHCRIRRVHSFPATATLSRDQLNALTEIGACCATNISVVTTSQPPPPASHASEVLAHAPSFPDDSLRRELDAIQVALNPHTAATHAALQNKESMSSQLGLDDCMLAVGGLLHSTLVRLIFW